MNFQDYILDSVFYNYLDSKEECEKLFTELEITSKLCHTSTNLKRCIYDTIANEVLFMVFNETIYTSNLITSIVDDNGRIYYSISYRTKEQLREYNKKHNSKKVMFVLERTLE